MTRLTFLLEIASPARFTSAPSILLTLLLGLAAMGVLVWRRERLAGTTLMAPWAWTLFTIVSLVSCELLITLVAAPGAKWIGPLRYCAAMTTFCPAMALLGAKRPQDRGWQFIVLSLWILLSMPTAEALLFRPGEPVQLFTAWSWFLLVLMLLSLMNYLPTKFWLASGLVFAGQLLLVSEHLPLGAFAAWDRRIALACFCAALALAARGGVGRRRQVAGWDRVWIDFRDWFGAVWGLRVAERLRASATMYGWNLSPTWYGFVKRDPAQPLPEETEAELAQALRTLLRRFVSPQWVAERSERP